MKNANNHSIQKIKKKKKLIELNDLILLLIFILRSS